MRFSESKQARAYKFHFYRDLNRERMPRRFYTAMTDFDLASAVLHGFWDRGAPHEFDVEIERIKGKPIVVITAEGITWRGPAAEAFRRLIDLPEGAGVQDARAAFAADIANPSRGPQLHERLRRAVLRRKHE
jgi:hypothetical protein